MSTEAVYRETREHLLVLGDHLEPGREMTPVPALPGWTVKDTYAHLAGLCADLFDGRTEGAGSPEWSAAQIGRRAGRPFAAITTEWAERGPQLDDLLHAGGSDAPAFVGFDVWTHEQDIRSALGAPIGRDDDRVHALAGMAIDAFAERYARSGAPGVRIIFTGGDRVLGAGEVDVTLRIDDYELLRILFGRRSRGQMRRAEWTGDPRLVLDHLHLFELPANDLLD